MDEPNPELLIFDAEIKAQEQIALFLRKRCDLTQLFQLYPTYTASRTYFTGDTVWYSASGDSYLYAPFSATTSNPSMNSWYLVEARESLIVDWMTTISLYKLHQRVSPDIVPTHRQSSYDEAMKLLRLIQEEKISPPFKEIENRTYNIFISGRTDSGISFQW